MGRTLSVALVLATLLGAGAGGRAARADEAETERRLKAVGVSDDLRAAVHSAIDRAVEFLRNHQQEDGSFDVPDGPHAGATALCALALRHAGTPRGREAATRARGWLFPREDATRSSLLADVYFAGIALLFLRADGKGEAHAPRLAHALVVGQDAHSGWWPYATHVGGPPQSVRSLHELENLSTTQFAVLGLWAAQAFDPTKRTVVWRRHLESLLRTQTLDGSWPYEPAEIGRVASTWGPWSSPTYTAAGIAGLVLAEAALGRDDPVLRGRADEVRRAKEEAVAALRRQAPWVLRGLGDEWPFYSLYALEKACIFLGIERLGDVPWYATGATRLVALQADDGGWNGETWRRGTRDAAAASAVVESAFALLFLLRVSETYRPVTPSDVDAPPPLVLTPSDGGAPPPAPVLPPPPAPEPQRVPLSEAKLRLGRLRLALGRATEAEATILAALDDVARAEELLVADPGLERAFPDLRARFAEEVDAALLYAFGSVVPAPGGDENRRARVNLRAAQLLASPPARAARVAAGVREALEKVHLEGRLGAGPDVLGAGFDVLAEGGRPEDAGWLAERVDTDQRPERLARTERVLRTLSRFRRLPGAVRRDVVERILRAWEPQEALHDRVQFGANVVTVRGPPATIETYYAWERVKYDAILAALALGKGTGPHDLPRDRRSRPLVTLKDLRDWWRDHDDLRVAPWNE